MLSIVVEPFSYIIRAWLLIDSIYQIITIDYSTDSLTSSSQQLTEFYSDIKFKQSIAVLSGSLWPAPIGVMSSTAENNCVEVISFTSFEVSIYP